MRSLLSPRLLMALAAAGVISGCASQDVAVQPVAANSADPSIVTIEGPRDPQTSGQVLDADGYPTFNTPLTAANSQMDDDQAKALSAKLSALGRARKAGVVSEAEYQRQLKILRDLAENHGRDTKAAIGH